MRILAVDLSHLARMAWEAGINKSTGEAFRTALEAITKARDGFDRTIVCCDSGRSFRCARAPEYKAGRVDPGDAYRDMVETLAERLAADGATVLRAPPVSIPGEPHLYAEADDVIGWLAARYLEEIRKVDFGWHLRILSGDSDLEQLIHDAAKIDVMKPAGMVGGGGIWTEATVLEKRGVKPSQIVDLKALAGDSTDNYKPFPGDLKEDGKGRKPGIGEEGAKKLLAIYGDAMSVFSEASKATWESNGLPPAMRYLLEKHGVDAAAKGLFLATLITDLPLDFAAVLAEPVVKPIAGPEPFDDGEGLGDGAPPPQKEEPRAMVVHRPATLAIDPSQPDWALALQPRDAAEAWQMAKHLFESRLFSKFGSPAAIWTVILLGREYGLSALTSLQAIHMIDGKPEMAADMIAALVLRSGKAKRFAPVILEAERVVYEVQRHDDPEPLRVEFNKAHAVARGLWGRGAWSKMQEVMLEHRCATKAARLKFPDVVRNLYGSGEVSEARAVDAEFVE